MTRMTQTQNPSLYRNVPIARNLDTRENYWFLYASKRLQKPEKDEDDPESSGREMVVFEDATANSAICMELNKTAKDTWFVDSCTSFHLTSLRSAYVEYRRVPKEEITPEDIFIDANGKPSHHVGIGTVMQKHTIVNSFVDSGMWPPSTKAAIRKMRPYKKRKGQSMMWRTMISISQHSHVLALKRYGLLPLPYEPLGIEITRNSRSHLSNCFNPQ
jgi:hypothetical protein